MRGVAAWQLALFDRTPPRQQFLKWVGNKHRYAAHIAQWIPERYRRYIEPFVGSGAVLAAVAPRCGLAGDSLGPLIEIWTLLKRSPEILLAHYRAIWGEYVSNPKAVYESVRDRYNASPNGLDLLFLCRACYGGVVRFTRGGTMSTPVGPHRAISPDALATRIQAWRERISGTEFVRADFEETMAEAGEGDVVYCDPPYLFSQSILYGSQDFLLQRLWQAIAGCKARGARALVSLDGMKKSGTVATLIEIPGGLFERESMVDCGGSMLRRFQKRGEDMSGERVHDRLLLTW